MAITRMGPGTITVGTVPLDFSAEVRSVTIAHEYDESSEAVTYLDGSGSPASLTRADSVSFEADNDLSAQGIYAFCETNDLTEHAFEYVPSTADAASWAGTVQVTLPEEIGSDAFGNPIASATTWAAVGKFTFTPIAPPPGA